MVYPTLLSVIIRHHHCHCWRNAVITRIRITIMGYVEHLKCCKVLLDPVGHFEWHHVVYKGAMVSSKFSSINVPVDGLAPLGARTSAGTVMTRFRCHIFTAMPLGNPVSHFEWHHVIHKGAMVSSKFSSINVPVDGVVPLGARTSAGTVMTRFRCHIFTAMPLGNLGAVRHQAIT